MRLLLRALVLAAVPVLSVHAQSPVPPPLQPGEAVYINRQGCAVVTRQQGQYLDALFDKACRPGELLAGPVALMHPGFGEKRTVWFDAGRRFGVTEPTPAEPRASVQWDDRQASFPIGIDTPEELARRVDDDVVSVTYREQEREFEVFVGRRWDQVGLPKEQRWFQVVVMDPAGSHFYNCPDKDPASCFDLWKTHAVPLMERGRQFLDEARPQVEARKTELLSQLRATATSTR